MQKRDFETYEKRFRDFEILPKFSENHVFRGTIRHPYAFLSLSLVFRWSVMLLYKNKGPFSPLNSSIEYVDWLTQFSLTTFHQLICFCPSILLLLALCIFVIIVDDFCKFQSCSQSWMHLYWIFFATRIPSFRPSLLISLGFLYLSKRF